MWNSSSTYGALYQSKLEFVNIFISKEIWVLFFTFGSGEKKFIKPEISEKVAGFTESSNKREINGGQKR